MNFGKLLTKLNNDTKTEVRLLEKLKKKLINLTLINYFKVVIFLEPVYVLILLLKIF